MKLNMLASFFFVCCSYAFSLEIADRDLRHSYYLYKNDTFNLVKVIRVKKGQVKVQHVDSTFEWVTPHNLYTEQERNDKLIQINKDKNKLTNLILGEWIWEQQHKMENALKPRGIYRFKKDDTVSADLEIFNWKCKGNYQILEHQRDNRDYLFIDLLCNNKEHMTIKLALHDKPLNSLVFVSYDLEEITETDLITFVRP